MYHIVILRQTRNNLSITKTNSNTFLEKYERPYDYDKKHTTTTDIHIL